MVINIVLVAPCSKKDPSKPAFSSNCISSQIPKSNNLFLALIYNVAMHNKLSKGSYLEFKTLCSGQMEWSVIPDVAPLWSYVTFIKTFIFTSQETFLSVFIWQLYTFWNISKKLIPRLFHGRLLIGIKMIGISTLEAHFFKLRIQCINQ